MNAALEDISRRIGQHLSLTWACVCLEPKNATATEVELIGNVDETDQPSAQAGIGLVSIPSVSQSANRSAPGRSAPSRAADTRYNATTLTIRQAKFVDNLWLPQMEVYPDVPSETSFVLGGPAIGAVKCSKEMQRARLLDLFKDFVFEMFCGCYLTQLTRKDKTIDIHCQITEDLQILKLDQRNGQVVEFPLNKCASLHRIAMVGGESIPILGAIDKSCFHGRSSEFLVVVEWERCALIFAFQDCRSQYRAERFVVCMQLLVACAKELEKDAQLHEQP